MNAINDFLTFQIKAFTKQYESCHTNPEFAQQLRASIAGMKQLQEINQNADPLFPDPIFLLRSFSVMTETMRKAQANYFTFSGKARKTRHPDDIATASLWLQLSKQLERFVDEGILEIHQIISKMVQ